MQAVRSWLVGLALAAGMVGAGSGPAGAATIFQVRGPAEEPPADYRANQYVDSRGCLFIRAGRGGATRWVPRAERNRQVMCGYRPTFPNGVPRTAGQGAAAAASPNAAASGRVIRRRNYIEVIPDQSAYRAAQNGTYVRQPGPRTGRRPPAAAPRSPAAAAPAPAPAAAQRRSQGSLFAWLFGQPQQRRVVRQPAPAAAVPRQASPARAQGPFSNPPAGTRVPAMAVATGGDWAAGNDRGLPVRTNPQPVHPTDYARVVQGYGAAAQPRYRAPAAYVTPPVQSAPQAMQPRVAGQGWTGSRYWTAGNERGLAVRYGPQAIHPSDYARVVQGYGGQQGQRAGAGPQAMQPRVAGQGWTGSRYWTAGNERGLAVRYGPQAIHPSDYARVVQGYGGQQGQQAANPANYVTRIQPQGHVGPYTSNTRRGAVRRGLTVYDNPGPSAPVVIPPGYEPVYPEGRLPGRVPGMTGTRVVSAGPAVNVYTTASGSTGAGVYVTPAAMPARRLMWTSYMPHKLYDVTTGQDVTAMYPELQYPYTDLALQREHLGEIRRGRSARRGHARSRDSGGADAPYVPEAPVLPVPPLEDDASPENMSGTVGMIRPRVVEDTAAAEEAAAAAPQDGVKTYRPSRARYVQVATFAVPDNAARLRARFDAEGLPTHARPLVRGANRYQIVLLGPFADEGQLRQALRHARALGFGDAFTVN